MMRYFHITAPWNRQEIRQDGLQPARELFPDEYAHLREWDSAGDADYAWFHGLPAPPDMTRMRYSHDVWELTRPELYILEEDSNYENGAGNPYYKTVRVLPEHLRLVHCGEHEAGSS